MSLDPSQYDSIRSVLDDETGKLLAIEVIDPDMDIPEKALAELSHVIGAYYAENLGLTLIDAVLRETTPDGYAKEILTDVEACYFMTYLCADENYGEVSIEVGVDSHGFYIFPV